MIIKMSIGNLDTPNSALYNCSMVDELKSLPIHACPDALQELIAVVLDIVEQHEGNGVITIVIKRAQVYQVRQETARSFDILNERGVVNRAR